MESSVRAVTPAMPMAHGAWLWVGRIGVCIGTGIWFLYTGTCSTYRNGQHAGDASLPCERGIGPPSTRASAGLLGVSDHSDDKTATKLTE